MSVLWSQINGFHKEAFQARFQGKPIILAIFLNSFVRFINIELKFWVHGLAAPVLLIRNNLC